MCCRNKRTKTAAACYACSVAFRRRNFEQACDADAICVLANESWPIYTDRCKHQLWWCPRTRGGMTAERTWQQSTRKVRGKTSRNDCSTCRLTRYVCLHWLMLRGMFCATRQLSPWHAELLGLPATATDMQLPSIFRRRRRSSMQCTQDKTKAVFFFVGITPLPL